MSVSKLIHIRDYMKITLGPALLMMALVVFLSKYSSPLAFLGALGAISVPVVWRFQLKGAIYASTLLFLSFITIYSFQESPYSILWIFFWCLALSSGLVITALCSREHHLVKLVQQEEEQERVLQLEQGYQITQKHLEEELVRYVGQVGSLEQELTHRDHELSSLKQLVMASKEEANKYFMQSEHLHDEILKLNRKVATIEEIEYLSRQLEAKNKLLLKQLNDARVQSYQYELLATASVAHVPLEQKVITPHEQRQYQKDLSELEQERSSFKRLYEEHLRDYQALSDKLQTFFTLDELAYYTHRELSFENSYGDLKNAFQEKGKLLQEMRVEIFKLEGTILQLKKELNIPVEESLSPGSYLAVADQECLRLEEENAILLQLVSQTLPLLEKRLREQEPKVALESHTHFE